MIVRERSNVSESPRKGPAWPPKSPLQAILSSPKSRRNYEERHRSRPVSPSPIKRSFSPTKSHVAPLSVSSSDEDEDDEETLQLKLKAIEAKLKLKKLQQAKEKHTSTPDLRDDPFGGRGLAKPGLSRKGQSGEDERENIQVPLSPPRPQRALPEPRSPARVLLGIDKGLKAQHVSLKRSANTNGLQQTSSRPTTSSARRRLPASGAQRGAPMSKPKSFSERIAESREADRKSQEKKERIQQSRSRGFGLDVETASSNNRGDNAQSLLRQHSLDVKGRLANASSTPRADSIHSKTGTADLESGLEPFSGIHISSRKLQHQTLTRLLTDKALYPLPKLLKAIKGPAYDPPDEEGDYVVLGIIASKSTPRDHANRKTTTSLDADDDAKAAGKHKFMVLRLTDLKWEVDLFLFDTAFSRFWKLTPGTVVAVLNPGIMPPRQGREDTGVFALKLASSEDTIIEIGTARHLCFCKSIKKDGQECGSWVNSKKTEFCEFHVNLQIEKARATRMEVNSMVRFGAKDKTGGKHINSRSLSKQELAQAGLRPVGGRDFDYETKEAFYAVPGRPGRGTATLLDEAMYGTKRDRDELLRKRREAREREIDLTEKLSKIGTKAGGEYLRRRRNVQNASASTVQSASQTNGQDLPQDTDLAVQGLLGRKAADVTLSPVHKRKRAGGGGTSSEPLGWGGAYKRGLLLNPKKPVLNARPSEAGHDEETLSPSKKRARFMLEDKGLREPGRDSFGLVASQQDNDEDDDDDLDIIE